jgi:hypothetical protein
MMSIRVSLRVAPPQLYVAWSALPRTDMPGSSIDPDSDLATMCIATGKGAKELRLLIIEDDVLLGSSTKAGLEQHGYTVDWVKDPEAADRALTTHR